ncbi:FAD:protein FMN transferase [Clostridium tarantellae]|uniref:FAD:protein FMN transferase n=2 Tax=Clostridium tarantellae TaxID=39493 RepID=A0A6I1MSY3_9CLOT|nr:FAD:protein FMN transferase [Clostridium tarantellae]
MKNKIIITVFSIMLIILVIFAFEKITVEKKNFNKQTPISKQGFYLDTIIDIKIFDKSNEDILQKAFQLCDYYENIFSRTKKGSEIYNLNKSGISGLKVSDETLEVIKKGIYYSEKSNGSFDITIAPISNLWNFNNEEHYVPNEDEIKVNLEKVNYKDIEINGNVIRFKKDGMAIDLGAIAKGYIADKIKELLKKEGVKSAIINLGGNVLCVGKKNSEDFKVGIQKPFKDRGETIDAVSIDDKSVVSSGIYERFFEKEGKLYHHILNTKTGYPMDNYLEQVTIISKKSIDGDALSTVCFSEGIKKGMELINSLDNIEALFVDKDGNVYESNNWNTYIE